MKTDIYQRVTDQIVAELEKGVRPWLKPWNADHAAGRITRPLRANGIPYRGINVLMLWAAATERGNATPLWLTYKQAQELGGQVRKGEKAALSFTPTPSPRPLRTRRLARIWSGKFLS